MKRRVFPQGKPKSGLVESLSVVEHRPLTNGTLVLLKSALLININTYLPIIHWHRRYCVTVCFHPHLVFLASYKG